MEIPKRSSLKSLKTVSPARKSLSDRPIPCPDNTLIQDLSSMIELATDLLESLEQVFNSYYPSGPNLVSKCLFSYKHVWLIGKTYCTILLGQHLQLIFGSEPLPGTWNAIIPSNNG
ncbi:hypothetical protein CROQUDRAFT_40381 [Cronartium quercuum f. sp. fusiforme G11]|uniref:Uncharacterized protein n=1 Tax=Cronartium quercuum f. sp. fusiforme G11 TaxID=708437 RepID=A0A9P6NRM6_9BASI|nr:hypothetical protein CROQUDRAFT_40381 [Cronartium quercuum f. sp. fusiforme G11]